MPSTFYLFYYNIFFTYFLLAAKIIYNTFFRCQKDLILLRISKMLCWRTGCCLLANQCHPSSRRKEKASKTENVIGYLVLPSTLTSPPITNKIQSTKKYYKPYELKIKNGNIDLAYCQNAFKNVPFRNIQLSRQKCLQNSR
jgi:hypothetical protein